MPCCTLTVFLLSQLGLAAGAVKARFFGGTNFAPWLPEYFRYLVGRWRWASVVACLSAELILVGAAAPYVVTRTGRTEAARSFAGAWHICSVGVAFAENGIQRPIR